MRIAALDIWVDGDEQPHGILGERVAALNLSTTVGSCPAIVGALDPATAAYLRRLATEADKLADAIEARLAESAKPEPTCYCDADLVAPHPFSECPHRMAEQSGGTS